MKPEDYMKFTDRETTYGFTGNSLQEILTKATTEIHSKTHPEKKPPAAPLHKKKHREEKGPEQTGPKQTGPKQTGPEQTGNNCVCVISIGRDRILDRTLFFFEKYCEKNNLSLKVIEKPAYHLPVTEDYNYNTFEKNQVYKVLQKYDRVLRLDDDIIIRRDCPDLFKLVPEDMFAAVFEDVGSRVDHRKRQIVNIKKTLGAKDASDWTEGYFNSGVILCSAAHKSVFNINTLLPDITELDLGPFKEQSVLNFKVREAGIPVLPLSWRYNHMSLFSEAWNNNASRDNSAILHYAGVQNKPYLQEDIEKYRKEWNE